MPSTIFLISNIIKYILAFAFTILFHEIGHVYYLRKLNNRENIYINFSFNPLKISAGKQEDYLNLSTNDKNSVYFAGIYCGFLVIFFLSIADPKLFYFAPIYLLGCYKDLKLLVFTHHKKS